MESAVECFAGKTNTYPEFINYFILMLTELLLINIYIATKAFFRKYGYI